MADHVREHGSLLAGPEKRLLIAIARRLPTWVTSDQLTILALASMCLAGAGFALARWDTGWLWVTVAALAANWFGDSLDGTLARVRRTERPRYWLQRPGGRAARASPAERPGTTCSRNERDRSGRG